MNPSSLLQRCNGQDITRKGGKGKNRIMMVLPTQIAVVQGTEGTLGSIEKINTNNPELLVPTNDGKLLFRGHFVETTDSCFLGIDLMPKKMQSICTDVISRILVFDEPILLSKDIETNSPDMLTRNASLESSAPEDMMMTQETNILSQDDAPYKDSYRFLHGCSATARHGDSNAVLSLSRKSDSLVSETSSDKVGDVKHVKDESEIVEINSDDDGDESSIPIRPSSRRSTARKAVNYNVDDIASDSDINYDDFAPKADSEKALENEEPKKPVVKTNKRKKSISIPKTSSNKVKQPSSGKDPYDLCSSSDSEFLADTSSPVSAIKRTPSNRPVRSSAKKLKSYHFESQSSEDDCDFSQ